MEQIKVQNLLQYYLKHKNNMEITTVILLVIGIINFIIATFIYIFGYRLSNRYYLSAKYLAYTFWGLAFWSWSLLDYQENLQIKFGYFQDMFYYFIIWFRFSTTGFAIYALLMFAITWGENSNFDLRRYRFLKWTAIICNTIILVPVYGLVLYGETEPLRGSFGNIITMIYILTYFFFLV